MTPEEIDILVDTDVLALRDLALRYHRALEQIGRCCGNANFVANEALGHGRVAHPDK